MQAYQQTFIQILTAAIKGEVYAPPEAVPAEEWEQIIRCAQEHEVLPLVFEACHREEGLKELPICGAVRQQAVRDVFTQTRKTGEFLALYRALRKAGVTPLVVKGIVCRDLYPQPDYRPSSDEDVLIPPEQFALCHKVMLDFGMETAEQPENFQKCYEIPYGKKGSPLYIELHKSLFPEDSDAYSEFNEFFAGIHGRAVEVTVDRVKILTMAPTDHLFYLICHAFKHFLHGGFGIRQVCDIALFARRYGGEINWTQVLENCERIRAEKFAAALFSIGSSHLDLPTELPEAWKMDVDPMPMLEDLLASGIYGSAEMERRHSSNITINALVRQKQGKAEGGGVLKSLFPSASSLEHRYPYLKKHPYLLPVAWGSRAFRFAVKNGGSEGAAKTIRIGSERVVLMKQYGILDE